jgi:hypothetical protein
VEPESAPDLNEGRHHHPEAEDPDEGDHEPDVEAGEDPGVVCVAGYQDVPETRGWSGLVVVYTMDSLN